MLLRAVCAQSSVPHPGEKHWCNRGSLSPSAYLLFGGTELFMKRWSPVQATVSRISEEAVTAARNSQGREEGGQENRRWACDGGENGALW